MDCIVGCGSMVYSKSRSRYDYIKLKIGKHSAKNKSKVNKEEKYLQSN